MLRLALAAAAVWLLLPGNALAAAGHVVISQVYGGGGNSGAVYTNDFVELFNPTAAPVSVDGWSIQYTSATGTGAFGSASTQITPLSGTIPPGQYLLVQEAAGATPVAALPTPDLTDPSAINMSGTGGKVALVSDATSLGCNGGSTPCSAEQLARIVDLVGWDGANFFEGAPAPATTNGTALLRNDGGCTDTDSNADDFIVGAPDPRNSSSPLHVCGGPVNQPVVASCGAPLDVLAGTAADATVNATDADGTVTALEVASVTPSPAPGSIARTGFSPASAVGGTASATVHVDAAVPAGAYSVLVAAANDDGTPQTDTCTLSVRVATVHTIGEVQGSVPDTADGATFASPYAGQTVLVQGVVTQTLLTSDSSHAFFLQSTSATSDGDPLSSDGIYVYEGKYGDLRKDGGGFYYPKVGDELILRGPVQEYYGQTELSNPYVAEIVSSGVAAVPAPVVADPPDDLAAANRYWERHEGMLMQVPAQSVALNGRDVFSPADAEIWFARPDSVIAERTDPYTRRAFRDAHPLDDLPGLFDNGNGYRILVGSFGVKAAADDPSLLLTPVRTFDTLTNAPAGGLYFDYGKYAIEATEQPAVVHGVDPSLNAPPRSFVREKEYSVATFNVENLYDYRDDPNDGCDFTGNPGCPGVKPPFDYVPASEQAYQTRLHDIARQIAGAMHAPDLILVQEAEDQDICSVVDGAMQCGTADNADGKPDTLQDLALAIAAEGGPAYDAAFDRDGADDRGIVSGFLYRTDRVQLLPVSASDPVLGSSPQVVYRGAPLASNADVQNPKTLNAALPADVDRSTGTDGNNVFTRAPQVGHFRVWRVGIGEGTFVDLWAISNHFSSGPDTRVGQRTEQAAYDAAIVAAVEQADPQAKIVLGGDLNVYPRPDDPFADAPSDQLGPLYEQGLQNLWDTIAEQVPSAAYSYVYAGQAQTLDQLFVSGSLMGDLVQARYAHVNSDWPKDEAGDGPYGTSDHDPLVARFVHVPAHAGGTLR